jgi:hypothetical protein
MQIIPYSDGATNPELSEKRSESKSKRFQKEEAIAALSYPRLE